MSFRYSLIAVTSALIVLSAPHSMEAAEDIALVGGSEEGELYQLGQKLCAVLNRKSQDIGCTLVPMPAGDAPDSYASIVNVRDGAAEVGIARSDWQHFAVTGTGPVRFVHGEFDTIRSLFSVEARPFTLLAKQGSGIEGVDDLEGKRVNLGQPWSDERGTMNLVLASKGWDRENFALAEEMPSAEQSLAFCHGWVEAVSYDVSHPDTNVGRITELCDADIVPVTGPEIDKLLAEKPYLAPMTIPGGLYQGVDEPVETFGSTITLVSSTDVPEDVVYEIVAAFFENLETLKRAHPALRQLDPGQMISSGHSAPLHDGARRYFSEQGLM